MIKHHLKKITKTSYKRNNSTTPNCCKKCGKFSNPVIDQNSCICASITSIQSGKKSALNESIRVKPTNCHKLQTFAAKVSGFPLKTRNFSSIYRVGDTKMSSFQSSDSLKDSYAQFDSSYYDSHKKVQISTEASSNTEKLKKLKKFEKLKNRDDSSKYKFLVFKGNNSILIKSLLELRSNWCEGYYSLPSSASFIWMPTSHNIRFERLKPSCAVQIVNHLECHSEVSNKSRLYFNLLSYCTANNMVINNLVPMTFVIDFRNNNYFSQIHSFKVFMINVKSKNLPASHFIGKNIWIMKPAGFNRGRGIKVFNDFDVLDDLVKEILANKSPGSAHIYVIQKYIEKPLLIHNRKFDIRVWVLVTQNENCYFFQQGYLRTSSEKFSLDNLSSSFIHLTNNAIQKEGTEYGKFEDGNQMSFKQFQEYLLSHFGNIRLSSIVTIMKSQIITSLLAVKGKLNPNNRLGCFEIFGYDFIIDSCFKPWLIEVNTNPCIELASPLLEQIIPRMLDDALELTLDAAFPCNRIGLKTETVIDLPPGNLWEFLVCLSSSAGLMVSGFNMQ